MHTGFLVGKPEGMDCLTDQGVDGSIILKRILKSHVGWLALD